MIKPMDEERISNLPIAFNGHSLEETISYLSECNVTLQGEMPIFSRPARCAEWPDPIVFRENKQLELFWHDGQHLAWRLFDRQNKKVSCIYAASHPMLTNLLTLATIEERRDYIRDFNITIRCDSQENLQAVALDKLFAYSQFNSDLRIDRDVCAVTLISTGTSSGVVEQDGFGHAEIICEGIERGVRFTRALHLVNPEPLSLPRSVMGTVVYALRPKRAEVRRTELPTPCFYTYKTPTWIRTKAQVQRMLDYEEGNITFAFTGSFSYPLLTAEQASAARSSTGMNWGHNCLTWAIERLRLCGIMLPRIDSDMAIPQDYVSSLDRSRVTVLEP